ncbi:MAG: tyrosine-type recombinase/integrase [Thermoanaerobacter sp.]|nr:tyrosine-type recombinase/integrase [Thermoanaerobacter sp.]
MARGHIRQRGENSWEIIYDAPRQPGQKRNQKSLTVRGTKKDAERKLREILHQIDTNTYVDPGKITFGQFLNRWLNDYCKINLTQTTYDGYKLNIEKHIIPALGDIRLSKLQPLHLQGFYRQALESGRLDGKGGLSPKTVHQLHRIIHRALEVTVKWQLLGRNVADAVEPPKCKDYEARVYDEKDVERLLSAAEGTRMYAPILLTLATGLRRGELLGLRWEDVDFKKHTITVNQTLYKTSAGLEIKTPKTKKSRRTITLPASVVDELKRHKANQAKEKLQAGEFYTDHGLVFCREDGSPWNPRSFSRDYRDLLKKHNLPLIRFHDLRHTHASILLRQGVHPKVVSERLGHSQIGITLDIYSHILPGIQEEVAKQLDENIFTRFAQAKKLPTKLPT